MSEQKHKGIIAISTIISVASAAIALSGIIFGFGGTIATIKSDTVQAKEMSAIAITKADKALNDIVGMKTDISWIKSALEEKGFKVSSKQINLNGK